MKLSKFRNIDKYIIGNKFDLSFGKFINKIGYDFASYVFEFYDLLFL